MTPSSLIVNLPWALLLKASFVDALKPELPKTCDPNKKNQYDVDWFLRNKDYKGLIEGRALLYTHPLSEPVRRFTTQRDGFYVSIWNVCK